MSVTVSLLLLHFGCISQMTDFLFNLTGLCIDILFYSVLFGQVIELFLHIQSPCTHYLARRANGDWVVFNQSYPLPIIARSVFRSFSPFKWAGRFKVVWLAVFGWILSSIPQVMVPSCFRESCNTLRLTQTILSCHLCRGSHDLSSQVWMAVRCKKRLRFDV